MQHNDIKVGGFYKAKISGVITTVLVTDIQEVTKGASKRTYMHYYVRNVRTGRTLIFRSCQKFRSVVELLDCRLSSTSAEVTN